MELMAQHWPLDDGPAAPGDDGMTESCGTQPTTCKIWSYSHTIFASLGRGWLRQEPRLKMCVDSARSLPSPKISVLRRNQHFVMKSFLIFWFIRPQWLPLWSVALSDGSFQGSWNPGVWSSVQGLWCVPQSTPNSFNSEVLFIPFLVHICYICSIFIYLYYIYIIMYIYIYYIHMQDGGPQESCGQAEAKATSNESESKS